MCRVYRVMIDLNMAAFVVVAFIPSFMCRYMPRSIFDFGSL